MLKRFSIFSHFLLCFIRQRLGYLTSELFPLLVSIQLEKLTQQIIYFSTCFHNNKYNLVFKAPPQYMRGLMLTFQFFEENYQLIQLNIDQPL